MNLPRTFGRTNAGTQVDVLARKMSRVIARAVGASVVGKLAGGAIATMAPYTGTWEFCPSVTVAEDRRRALMRAPVSAPCGRSPPRGRGYSTRTRPPASAPARRDFARQRRSGFALATQPGRGPEIETPPSR